MGDLRPRTISVPAISVRRVSRWLVDRLERLELREEGLMVDVTGAVAGEPHVDHAVNHVD